MQFYKNKNRILPANKTGQAVEEIHTIDFNPPLENSFRIISSQFFTGSSVPNSLQDQLLIKKKLGLSCAKLNLCLAN